MYNPALVRFCRRTAFAAVSSVLFACAGSAAKADVHWVINDAVFNDGTTLTGDFFINVYGYLDGYDLTTVSKDPFVGFNYTPSDSYFANGAFYIDAQPGYQGDLHITFADNLSVGVFNNPIIGGSPGPSYECQGSYSCYVPLGGDVRYIASGVATAVPEPATWAVMLLGFVGLGVVALRRTKNNGAALAAA
jgi:hypothetical protein